MRTSPVILDRLQAAMKAHGFDATRSQALQVAASAFGFHSSNEFTAAAKRGDLDPPRAESVGKARLPDGQEILLVRDPVADAPYGIDMAFLDRVVDDTRREAFGPSPYGHLLDLRPLVEATSPGAEVKADPAGKAAAGLGVVRIHIATLSHRHGDTAFAAASPKALEAKLAAWCLQFWDEVEDHVSGFDTDAATDAEIVSAYFDAQEEQGGEEYYSTHEEDLDLSDAERTTGRTSGRSAADAPLAPFRTREGSDVAGTCSHDVLDAQGRPITGVLGWSTHPDEGRCPTSAAIARGVARTLDGMFADADGREEFLRIPIKTVTVSWGDNADVLVALDGEEAVNDALAHWIRQQDADVVEEVTGAVPARMDDDTLVSRYFAALGDSFKVEDATLHADRKQLESIAQVSRR